MDQRTARLDPDVRRQLAEEIESTLKVPASSEENEEKAQEEEGGGGGGEEIMSPIQAAAAPSPTALAPRSQGFIETEEAIDTFEDADNEDETDIAISELDIALGESRAGLAKSEEAERFLGARVAKYRSMLNERAAMIDRMGSAAGVKESDGLIEETKFGDDVERGEGTEEFNPTEQELHAMREKHRKDEEALDKVVEMHKNMLIDIEGMRRKILELEQKREDIFNRRNECRDFLIAAAHAEEAEIIAGDGGAMGVGSCPLPLPMRSKPNGPVARNEKDPETGECLQNSRGSDYRGEDV